MEFVVGGVALGQVFPQVLRFLPVSIFSLSIQIRLFIYHRRYIIAATGRVVK
jgi:hypothetical protein